TLVDHVLMNAAPAGIGTGRPNLQIFVPELAPDAHQLQALSVVSLDQKIISHGYDSHLSHKLPTSGHAGDSCAVDLDPILKLTPMDDAGWHLLVVSQHPGVGFARAKSGCLRGCF